MTETTVLDIQEVNSSTEEDSHQRPRMQQAIPANPRATSAGSNVVLGELLALADCAQTAILRYPGQPGLAAVRARTSISLRGADIGRQVVLLFEHGDAARPIVIGLMRGGENWPLEEKPGHVEVDADGQRMLVSAREELVLRCGKASITLTKAGKVIIQGSSILSRALGSNRIKGGSVQLN
jgi:hypothetical protein